MKFQPPKGTRDLLPEDAKKMQKLIDLFRGIAEKYGFKPLITPAFESFELLSAKGGLGETVKDEMYYFKDKSDRELGLRFDMTMPLARVVSSNTQLRKPFKRYVIDKVWRYDNPQAMRWREFYQADVDIVGSSSLVSDVECLAVVSEFLDKLSFKDYFIRVNDREMIQVIFEKIINKEKILDVFRIVDKLDKIGIDGIEKELNKKGVNSKKIIEFFKEKKIEMSENLKEFFNLAKNFGIEKKLKFDISLMRGLEYYSGIVFEISLGEKVSCGGGGRYDNLIKTLGGSPMPATGISLGLDRIFEVMKERKMFDEKSIKSKIFVANVNDEIKDEVIKLSTKIRKNDIPCEIDLMNRNLTKQLEYADSSEIPYVIIVGKNEVKKKKFKFKDMKKKTEKILSINEIIDFLKSS